MPVQNKDELPPALRAYRDHGLDFSYRPGSKNVYCKCPFCQKENKFSIEVASGVWSCFVCNEGYDKRDNNGVVKATRHNSPVEFLRKIWEYSEMITKIPDYESLAKERGFLSPETLIRWQLVRSYTTGEWLMPGYNVKGSMTQLYRYTKVSAKGVWKHQLRPTTEVGGAAIFGLGSFDQSAEIIDVFEGWNGIAAEEVFKEIGGEPRNVIGLPGANTFLESWYPLFKGKTVIFWYDNDHPREIGRNGTTHIIEGAGWMYSNRNASTLSNIAKEVYTLKWGDKDHDPNLPSGYDVRDHLKSLGSLVERSKAIQGLSAKLVLQGVKTQNSTSNGSNNNESVRLPTKSCSRYAILQLAWRKALRWRKELDDALSVLLAVCLSTEQVGDQIYLQLIADAGSAKTDMLQALLTSDGCTLLENSTGMQSGWRGGGYSAVDRKNRKTLITPEGDLLMNNPMFPQLMAQMRRAFDGSLSSSYKNMKEDQLAEGLRMPWIVAGTPAMIELSASQSQVGDRFLRYIIPMPDDDEQTEIVMRAIYSEGRNVEIKSGKDAIDQMSPETREARSLTGGYVDWLRNNTELISEAQISDDNVRRLALLAKFTANQRARPIDKRKSSGDEVNDTKEMPTRLGKQFMRVARCLAVVLNRDSVDDDVMNRIRDVAIFTGRGLTSKIMDSLYEFRQQGVLVDVLAGNLGKSQAKINEVMGFLQTIRLADRFRPVDGPTGKQMRERWRLSPSMLKLYESVVVNWNWK